MTRHRGPCQSNCRYPDARGKDEDHESEKGFVCALLIRLPQNHLAVVDAIYRPVGDIRNSGSRNR